MQFLCFPNNPMRDVPEMTQYQIRQISDKIATDLDRRFDEKMVNGRLQRFNAMPEFRGEQNEKLALEIEILSKEYPTVEIILVPSVLRRIDTFPKCRKTPDDSKTEPTWMLMTDFKRANDRFADFVISSGCSWNGSEYFTRMGDYPNVFTLTPVGTELYNCWMKLRNAGFFYSSECCVDNSITDTAVGLWAGNSGHIKLA